MTAHAAMPMMTHLKDAPQRLVSWWQRVAALRAEAWQPPRAVPLAPLRDAYVALQAAIDDEAAQLPLPAETQPRQQQADGRTRYAASGVLSRDKTPDAPTQPPPTSDVSRARDVLANQARREKATTQPRQQAADGSTRYAASGGLSRDKPPDELSGHQQPAPAPPAGERPTHETLAEQAGVSPATAARVQALAQKRPDLAEQAGVSICILPPERSRGRR